uniref:Hydroxysteroid 17-beta dehydrogenase 2 n=1 Tax=Pavo cristatus TaxID=9049 RepID=A0A8C9L8R1_PAVCR
MDTLPSSPLGWLCVALPVLFGLCLAKRSYKAHVLLQSVLPALLGLLCVPVLGTCWGLIVFCSTWLGCSAYLDAGPLPVGDKAVLITGKGLGAQRWALHGGVLEKFLLFRLEFSVMHASRQCSYSLLEKHHVLSNDLVAFCTDSLSQNKFSSDSQVAVLFVGGKSLIPLPPPQFKLCVVVLFLVEYAAPCLLERASVKLYHVYIAPAGGIPLPRYAAYGASKAALSMFSGVMRQELSKWGIKVAAIHPSGFRTGIQGTSELWVKQEKELVEHLSVDVQQDYGRDYLLGLKSYLLQIPACCDADLTPVLSSILHALLAKRPHGLYTPGKGAYFLLCMFCYFPLWFYDFLVSKLLGLESIPQTLRTSEAENEDL